MVGNIAKQTAIQLYQQHKNRMGLMTNRQQNLSEVNKSVKIFILLVHDTSEPVSSMSWHPSNQSRLLTVTNSGVIEVVSLQEPIPLAWSPHGQIMFGYGKFMVEGNLALPEAKDAGIIDISVEMQQRASQGYSMDVPLILVLSQNR